MNSRPIADAPMLFARQPIMDARLDVVAYELLYRAPGGEGMTPDTDPQAATASVLVDVLFELGLQRIAGGVPVHVNFPAAMLAQVHTLSIPADQLVVEVLEDTLATPEVLAALQSLRQRGYRIALDDYVPGLVDPQLLPSCDLVKLDLAHLSVDAAIEVAAEMKQRGIGCIAEKVETRDQFERCAAGGIALHQGYFLQRPETFFGRRAPVNLPATMRLLLLLQQEDWDPREVERVIGADASLAWRLLRAVQSAQMYRSRRIENLSQAILVLGRDQIFRVVSLLALCRCGERPRQLVHGALLRARLMELLAVRNGQGHANSYFMAGLLSLMPAMLGCAPAEALAELPIAPEIHAAVLEARGEIGAALTCAVAIERAQWDSVRFEQLSTSDIRSAYLDACLWLEDTASLMEAA